MILLQSLYGMNSKSGYMKQYNQSLDKDVSRNKLSMADYYSRKANMMDSLMSDEDSMESCTQGTCTVSITTQLLYIKSLRCDFNLFPPRGSPLMSKIIWR